MVNCSEPDDAIACVFNPKEESVCLFNIKEGKEGLPGLNTLKEYL